MKKYDPVVSVKMPISLLLEMKKLIVTDHYLDMSEAVRSVVRKGCLQYTNPLTSEIKELKENIKTDIVFEQQTSQKQALIEELKRMVRGEDE